MKDSRMNNHKLQISGEVTVTFQNLLLTPERASLIYLIHEAARNLREN